MRRREFIALAGSATVAWPFAALAERQDWPARIGHLALGSSSRTQVYDDAFRAGLRDLDYVEGKNIHVEFRYAE
jgi:putative tryptophan/tyrosine transport system substrate-binding protein